MDTNQNYIIEINQIIKVYREQKVLNDITINFEKGKIHGIVGQNGSGKTMLLKAISGLIRLNSGWIKVCGKKVGKDFDFPPNIGAIIEHPGFLPQYSGFNNLKMLASLQNKIGTEEIKEAIKRVGLNPAEKKRVGHYSLGMKQRLGIAQAIMEKPDLYLLDEPLSGLDRTGQDEMRALLLELKAEGNTLLIVTHSDKDVDMLCNTIHGIDAGKIIF